MTHLRSYLYQTLFYLWTAVIAIASLPSLILPASVIQFISKAWSQSCFALLRLVTGLGYRVEGAEHISTEPVIYASKHQSAWDTMVFPILLKNPVVILKKELRWIPFYGWYLRKYGSIGVDRAAGAKALRGMVQEAREMIATGRPIVVFPQGTRTAPEERGTYQSGIAALYRELGVPVVPVALNSGIFWRRRSNLRRPGTIVLRFLPPIPPGLDRKAFMERLETTIESAQNELVSSHVDSLPKDGGT